MLANPALGVSTKHFHDDGVVRLVSPSGRHDLTRVKDLRIDLAFHLCRTSSCE